MAEQVQQQTVMDVIAEIRKDPKLTKEFIENPRPTLQKRGFDTAALTIQKLPPPTTEGLNTEAPQICASVGAGALVQACVSAGE